MSIAKIASWAMPVLAGYLMAVLIYPVAAFFLAALANCIIWGCVAIALIFKKPMLRIALNLLVDLGIALIVCDLVHTWQSRAW